MSDSDDMYGPPLPPGMPSSGKSKNGKDSDDGEGILRPPMPSDKKLAGKGKNKSSKHRQDKNDDDSEDDMYGPALPPHMLNKRKSDDHDSSPKKRVLGPTRPSDYSKWIDNKEDQKKRDDDSDESDDDDGYAIGPKPSDGKFNEEEYRLQQIESRAKKMKDQLTGKDDKPLGRETWMTELPDKKPNLFGLGLAPRQFNRKTPAPMGDRSVWTDTPADKERKTQMGKSATETKPEATVTPQSIASKRRDEELTEVVGKHNEKKRSESLIDIHQKKDKKRKEDSRKERKPFSREDDLHVNKFDDVQKATIIKKASKLNDRFSAGNRKFL